MSYFNAATLEMHDLDQSIVMTTMKDGLQKNSLFFSLEKKKSKDFIEMLDWAEKFVRAEEAFEKYGTSINVTIEAKKKDPKLFSIQKVLKIMS